MYHTRGRKMDARRTATRLLQNSKHKQHAASHTFGGVKLGKTDISMLGFKNAPSSKPGKTGGRSPLLDLLRRQTAEKKVQLAGPFMNHEF